MQLELSAEDAAFREEMRTFFTTEFPQGIRDAVLEGRHLSREQIVESQQVLNRAGLAVPHWPEEWGGRGWSDLQRHLWHEEMQRAGVPTPLAFNASMIGPVIAQFGSQEQKERFLPATANLDIWWSQGFSEPDAGSDLASLRTTAVRDGDDWVVNGQKTWTTLAHYADWIFCLVRTGGAEVKKQEGISFLLIDMKTPGITVRPLILMDGGHEVNEVFFDDVRVPVGNLVHGEGQGWTVAKYLLGHERMNTARIGTSRRELENLKQFAAKQVKGGKSLMEDVRFRDKVTRLEVELMALQITNLRFLDQLRGGRAPGAEVSMLKIVGTEIQQRITELMMEAAGPMALPFEPIGSAEGFDLFTATLAARYCNYRKTSIYAGSNEIQKNIIAKMALGL
jgi:alkylation response protein AidB-like acyl-CoA dehydrogenase